MADFIMNQKKTANFGRSKPAWRSWRTVLFKRKQEELPSLCLLWFSLAYFSPKNLFLHFVQDVRHTKRPCAVWCRAFLLCIRVNDLYCWENKPRLFSWVFNCCLGGNRYCGEILLSNTLSTHETVTYSARMACPLALRCYYIT